MGPSKVVYLGDENHSAGVFVKSVKRSSFTCI